jgi:hypothetical protein
MVIRVLLLAGLVAIGWFVFLKRNKLPIHIVTVFLLLAAGSVAVISPETTQWAAEQVGVGRGTDFVIYLSIVGVLFVLVHYYAKFVDLQRNLTQVVRELAVLRAEVEQTPKSSQPAAKLPGS